MADDIDDLEEGELDEEMDLEEDLDGDEEGLGGEDDDEALGDGEEDDDEPDPEVVLVAKVVDDEELDHLTDDDVEASLDEILKEKMVVDDEPEDDEAAEVDDRSDPDRVLPKQPDEFVCASCFLVKHPSQLADKKKKLCRDCV